MDNTIHILGAGKLAECTIDLLINENKYSRMYIYDDNIGTIQIGNKTMKVNGTIEYGKKIILANGDDYFVSLGVNHRELSLEIIDELLAAGKKPINVISKYSFISKSAILGYNCLIFPGVMIGCKVQIGNLLICYSNCSVEHHIQIGNGVVICPKVAIASNVLIRDLCFLGIGSIISNNIEIGANSIIGAGALVINTVEASNLAYGVPAKSRKTKMKIL